MTLVENQNKTQVLVILCLFLLEEELGRRLEESDYKQNDQSNSSNGEENETEEDSDVPDFDNDDSVADPDFFPNDLSPDRSSLHDSQVMIENINVQHSSGQHMDGDIFVNTATSHQFTFRMYISPDNSNDTPQLFKTTAPPDSDYGDDRVGERNAGPRTSIIPTTERRMKGHDGKEGWNYDGKCGCVYNISPLGL